MEKEVMKMDQGLRDLTRQDHVIWRYDELSLLPFVCRKPRSDTIRVFRKKQNSGHYKS